jgi:thioesterase domain-containing protein
LYDVLQGSYRLPRLDSRGILFLAEGEFDREVRSWDPTLGWKDVFGKGLQIVPVTGDHLSMIRHEPHNKRLAQELRAVLSSSNSTPLNARDEYRGFANVGSKL